MSIVVFGATGGTGRHVVGQALAAGHRVRAVVRREGVLDPGAGLTEIVVPDLADGEAVTRAIAGQNAVVSALGTNAKGPVSVCTNGIASILAGMARTGVRRLVAVSAHGAAETHDRSPYSLICGPPWPTRCATRRRWRS